MALAVAIGVAIAFYRPNSSSVAVVEEAPKAAQTELAPKAKLMTFEEAAKGALRATLEIEGRGIIVVELYPAAAPKTVAHFVSLCKQNFYKGILVHRVETDPKFRLFQAGDPVTMVLKSTDFRGKSTEDVAEKFHVGGGGSGQKVKLEAHLPNVANTLALARSDDPDSGDSQFYINLSDNHSLDSQYCVFGKIISGAEIAEKVEIGDRIVSFRLN